MVGYIQDDAMKVDILTFHARKNNQESLERLLGYYIYILLCYFEVHILFTSDFIKIKWNHNYLHLHYI